MIDLDALVFGPVYDTFGQPAVLTVGASSHDVVVIDQTRGVTVDEAGSIGVQTIRPAADVRRSELSSLGIAAVVLVDGEVEFNGNAWRIKSVIESGDELRLILMEALELVIHRMTEAGDRRITQAGDVRILE